MNMDNLTLEEQEQIRQESMNREIAASRISSIFFRETGFVSPGAIRDHLRGTGASYEDTTTALETMVQRRQLDYDPTHGYCKPGYKDRLLQRAQYLKTHEHISREGFERLNDRERTEFIQRGGLVV
jgi:hypothetical protein